MTTVTGIAGALLFAALLAPSLAAAKGSGGHTGGNRASGHSSSHAGSRSHGSGSRTVPGVARDSHGRIARSPQARKEFKKSHPCPSTGRSSGACPGYMIDHVVPLKRGGPDRPSNMQWQTKEAAKEKDKTE